MAISSEKVKEGHEDERRSLKQIFNGDFVARQLLTLEIKADCVLGGHYHEYGEIWYVLKGRLEYEFINIYTNKKQRATLNSGDKIKIPSRIYHKAYAEKDTIIVGVTEEEFVSEVKNNLKYVQS